jgi:quercetin dioxygenase-like cupin family protein
MSDAPHNQPSEKTAKEQSSAIRSLAEQPAVDTGWGAITWLVSGEEMPGAEQTLGVVTIAPGQQNPLHAHPNCEELLYVVSGECEHKLGEETYNLKPGSVIRIPRGIRHRARCTSGEPLVAVISFSAPDRRTETFETGEVAAEA